MMLVKVIKMGRQNRKLLENLRKLDEKEKANKPREVIVTVDGHRYKVQ